MSLHTESYLWPGDELSAQVLLSEGPDLAASDAGHTEHGHGLLESSLAIPLVLSAVSLFTLLIRSGLVRVSSSTKGEGGGIVDDHTHRPGAKARPTESVARGRVAILRFRLLRLAACLVLVWLNAFTFVGRIRLGVLGTYVRGDLPRAYTDPDDEIPQVHGSLLAAAAAFARPGIAKLANTHVNWILFGTWVVYVWRDVYPLGTFTLQPQDIEEGWFLWIKFGLLSVAAMFVPLFVPTEYIPLDPEVRHFEHHDTLP